MITVRSQWCDVFPELQSTLCTSTQHMKTAYITHIQPFIPKLQSTPLQCHNQSVCKHTCSVYTNAMQTPYTQTHLHMLLLHTPTIKYVTRTCHTHKNACLLYMHVKSQDIIYINMHHAYACVPDSVSETHVHIHTVEHPAFK